MERDNLGAVVAVTVEDMLQGHNHAARSAGFGFIHFMAVFAEVIHLCGYILRSGDSDIVYVAMIPFRVKIRRIMIEIAEMDLIADIGVQGSIVIPVGGSAHHDLAGEYDVSRQRIGVYIVSVIEKLAMCVRLRFLAFFPFGVSVAAVCRSMTVFHHIECKTMDGYLCHTVIVEIVRVGRK